MPPETLLRKWKSSLLERARTGSLEAVAAVRKFVERSEDQDLDICAAVMPCLSHSLIPSPDVTLQDASSIQNLLVASEAFQVITSVCQNRDQLKPALPEDYLPLFLEYQPHLFQWMEFFHRQKLNREFYRSLCTVTISTLLGLHDVLKTAILTIPSNVDAILSNWIKQDVFLGNVSMKMWKEGPCSSFFVVDTVFRHEEGKIILDDIFMTSPLKAQAFAKALIARISNIATEHAGQVGEMPSAFLSTYLNELLHLSSLFAKHPAGCRALLGSSTLFSATASVLLQVARNVGVQQGIDVWHSIIKCASTLLGLCFVVEQGTVDPLDRISSALQWGILQTICRCLVRLPLIDRNFSACTDMLGCLITCAMMHRPSLKHLLSAKSAAMDTVDFVLLKNRSQLVRKYACDFEITIEPIPHMMGTRVEREKRMGICDNINVRIFHTPIHT
ncbi:hypothetical protein H1R20_g8075, partial [Candolleomyces eurysporus]